MLPPASSPQHPAHNQADATTFFPVILNAGFIAALILAAVCFLTASLYMYRYLNSTDSMVSELLGKSGPLVGAQLDTIDLAIQARLMAARFSLLSCGVLAGLSFGLIGFCLFLVGAKGEISATAEMSNVKISLMRMAPGVFVLACATTLIALSVTHSMSLEEDLTPASDAHLTRDTSVAPVHDYPEENTPLPPFAAKKKEEAFQRILKMDQEAQLASQKERKASSVDRDDAWAERTEAYSTAAIALRRYLSTWERSNNTVEGLADTYRLGIYLEFADDFREAQKQYLICQEHPKINDPGALWDGKKIADVLPARLVAVSKSISLLDDNGGGGGGGVHRSARYYKKPHHPRK